MKLKVSIFLFLLLLLFAAACQTLSPSEDFVYLEGVGVAEFSEGPLSKAAPLTSIPSFYCWGYVYSGTSGPGAAAPGLFARELFSRYSGSTFRSAGRHGNVTDNYKCRYWGYAPAGASGISSEAGYATGWNGTWFSYTTPDAAASQSDIVVAVSGETAGSATVTTMTFNHVLCQVRVHTSFDNVPAGNVSNIQLTAVKYTGNYTASGWSSVGGSRTFSFNPGKNISAASENAELSSDSNCWMLLPQILTGNLKVTVSGITYTTSMSGVVLTAGRRITLRCKFSDASVSTGNDTDMAADAMIVEITDDGPIESIE